MSDSVHEDLKKGIEDLSKQLRYFKLSDRMLSCSSTLEFSSINPPQTQEQNFA